MEQATAMAAVIGELGPYCRADRRRHAVGSLASLAVGKAVGARFVREVFIGVYESDMGQLRPDPGAAFSYRHSIGADDIALFTNLTPEFASPLGTRTVADRAHGARFFGCASVCISGPRAGSAFRFADLEEAKAAVPDIPVLANTGVRHDTAERILETADGIIVGTVAEGRRAHREPRRPRARPAHGGARPPRPRAPPRPHRQPAPRRLLGRAARHAAPRRHHRAGRRRDRQRRQRAARRRRRRRRGDPPRGRPDHRRRVRHHRRLPHGEARATGAGALPARFVIHAVGPVWRGGGGRRGRAAGLRPPPRAGRGRRPRLPHRGRAGHLHGIYGFPIDRAAPIALREAYAAPGRSRRCASCSSPTPT